MKPLPKLLMLTVALLCGAVGLSAAVFGIVSLLVGAKPFWMIFGFELVTIVASALGVIFARGRFQEGQGMALACIAASMAVAAFLAQLSVQGQLQLKDGSTISLKGWLVARLGAALILGAIGAYAVLVRHPRSRGYVLRAVLTGGPVAAGALIALGARGHVESAMKAMPGWLSSTMIGVVGLLAVVLLSACGHCLVRAFEFGRTEKA
ncbi:MAG: hypothetical protein JNK25_10385 [Phycisphaerae bacterium]|nr:hypothetical protein [Phycisphaerae bacterium]